MHDEIPQENAKANSLETQSDRKANKRKYILAGTGVLLLICISLYATGIISFNTDFYAGGITIENVVVTNELGSDGRPVTLVNQEIFEPTERIDTAVYTSGIDATIGMRWFHNDMLLFELFERTRENYIATYLEGNSRSPLPSGDYRVEVYLGSTSQPKEVVHFTVNKFELETMPAYPTPPGHKDIENAPYLEIPFIFDDIWKIENVDWQINEVKIVFLSDAELFVIVVETDSDILDLSESSLETLTRPIAKYAVENGFLEQARQIQINGETFELNEPLAITLIDPDEPNRGHRIRFDIDSLSSVD